MLRKRAKDLALEKKASLKGFFLLEIGEVSVHAISSVTKLSQTRIEMSIKLLEDDDPYTGEELLAYHSQHTVSECRVPLRLQIRLALAAQDRAVA